ncbi:MAG: DUF5011 domain-containing protein [Bacteroidales bacterium]|nr:DUF5011 domain-containing protein [Bacteroidales bacterium]
MFSSCNKEEKTNDPYPPFIVLNGESVVWAELNKPYSDPGAVAFDITSDQDTIDISFRMVINNPVNTGQVGSYKVTYNIKDEAGNNAPEKSRTVFVNIF